MRIYVAGPMTGIPDLNFPLFHATAARLRAEGYDVVNPAEINADPSAGWLTCMRADIRELVTCDAIFLLPGWENSRGASLEAHIARKLGLQEFRDVPMVTGDFPIIAMGHGKIEVGDAVWSGLPALWFGNDGQGMGVVRDRNEPAKDGETLVVFTFANIGGLEAIEAAVARVREKIVAAEAPA